MGWYSCYKALKDNKVKTVVELNRKNAEAVVNANLTNTPENLGRAWDFAEKKIKEENLNNKEFKNGKVY